MTFARQQSLLSCINYFIPAHLTHAKHHMLRGSLNTTCAWSLNLNTVDFLRVSVWCFALVRRWNMVEWFKHFPCPQFKHVACSLETRSCASINYTTRTWAIFSSDILERVRSGRLKFILSHSCIVLFAEGHEQLWRQHACADKPLAAAWETATSWLLVWFSTSKCL